MPSLSSPHAATAIRPDHAELRQAQRVLTFTIGLQSYAVDILQVCEIRSHTEPLNISRSATDLLGLINLRGEMVPVFDLRLRLGAVSPRCDATTSVIVVELDGRRLGAVVDGVSDVLDLSAAHLRPVPSLPGLASSGHLRGIATIDDQMLVLIDIASLLGTPADAAVEAVH
ncbi:MAG: chemotaxis protein CheW [Burkholderiaceae bacterium]|nr:chemotaxis protein CheW [Burkholderiaceae bacterium]